MRNQANETDGIRISIMRFNRPYYEYDVLIPVLAPSEELLRSYKHGKIRWAEYEIRFRSEVLEKNKDVVKALSDMALENVVTILCWEKTPSKCHRRLVAEECKRYQPKLKIVLR